MPVSSPQVLISSLSFYFFMFGGTGHARSWISRPGVESLLPVVEAESNLVKRAVQLSSLKRDTLWRRGQCAQLSRRPQPLLLRRRRPPEQSCTR